MAKNIIINQDYLDALILHKRQNCPNLSGLNKRQLGQMARRLGLEVIATGDRERADGTGAGVKHKYPTRTKTTWEGTAEERNDRRNRDLNRKYGEINRSRQRILGQDVLDGVRDRIKKEQRDKMNEERDKKLKEIQEQQKPKEQPKPKPKPKKKLKIVKTIEITPKKKEPKKETPVYDEAKTNEYIRFRNIMNIDEGKLFKVLNSLDLGLGNLVLDKSKKRAKAIREISKKVGLEETKRLLKDL